jgi:hypothetical protein
VTSSLRRTREEAASPTATSATQTVLAIAVGAAPTSPSRGTPTTRPWLSVPSRSIRQMTGFDLDTTIQFGTREPKFSGQFAGKDPSGVPDLFSDARVLKLAVRVEEPHAGGSGLDRNRSMHRRGRRSAAPLGP